MITIHRPAVYLLFLSIALLVVDSKKDFVQPEEKHLDGIPKFIEQPDEQYFTMKGKPATITCVAEPASHVGIFCADKDYPYRGQNDPSGLTVVKLNEAGEEDPTGTRWKFSLKVTHRDVEEWFGRYLCYCEAWNKVVQLHRPKKVHSRKAAVVEAFFHKKFKQVPVDTSQKAGSDLILTCVPPEGKPEPEVHWLKNGNRINRVTFPHIVIDDYKQLIIQHPRPEDSGNYTCVATSMGQERLSPPGKVNVFVNGQWSAWSHPTNSCPKECNNATPCQPKCLAASRKRVRTCSNPAPVNGGSGCLGTAEEVTDCDTQCQVHGGWSEWTKWSTCDKMCRQKRLRSCSSPRPRNGGIPCLPEGERVQSRNCSIADCNDLNVIAQYIVRDDKETITEVDTRQLRSQRDIAMYIGLIFAIAVFITVVIVIIFLVMRRKSLGLSTHRVLRYSVHANGHHGGRQEKDSKKVNELLLPPDLTQTVVTIKNPNAVDIQPHYKAPSSGLQDSIYRAPPPLPPPPPSSSTYMTIDIMKQLPGRTTQATSLSATNQGSVVTGNGCTGLLGIGSTTEDDGEGDEDGNKSRPTSALYHELSLGRGSQVLANFIPSHLDVDSVAWGTINAAGGRLCLPESGVSLTIPQGAIPNGSSEEIFLAVCHDDKDKPRLAEHQTLLSPVVLCGPPGLNLMKSVIVSFPHCASLKHGGWLITSLTSNSSLDEPLYWQSMMTLGRETLNTPGYCQLDATTAHLMTDQLQRFSLVGESLPACQSHKALRLAAFSGPMSSCLDFNIRVYVIADTREAFERVVGLESELGGRLLDTPKQLLFRDGGSQLCFCIEELSLGWRSRLQNKFQEIPFSHIWSGNQSSVLHCAFTLEHIDPTRQTVSCKIVVYQDSFYTSRQIIHIASDKNDNLPTNPLSGLQPSNRMSSVTSSNGLHMDPLQTVFRLSSNIRPRICNFLDPPNLRGNDWRMLARQLGVDRYINYFATKPSPTDAILDLWEARSREEGAITDLKNSLRAMGRLEVAALLDQNATPAWL